MSTISNNDIAKAIYLASKDKSGAELKSLSSQVVSFLNRRHLLGKSDAIVLQLEKIINLDTNTLEAKVSSAKSLSEKTKTELIHFLKHKYKAKDVEMKEKVDENLLGGVRIEVKDEVIDLTVRNRMNKLQAYLIRD